METDLHFRGYRRGRQLIPWLSDIPVKCMVTAPATVLEKQGGTGKETGNFGMPEKRQIL